MYESAIHKNSRLTSIDKFNYLKSYLEDEAARSIEGLTLTEGNYVAAIEILKQRYGDKQQVISAHMEQLLKIPMCSGERSIELKAVYDKINVHVRGLESLGIDTEKYGSLLIPVIMARVPCELSLRIARLTSQEVWEINEVLEIIRKEVKALALSENVKIQDEKSRQSTKNEQSNRAKKNDFPSTASALLSKSGMSSARNCVFCGENHYSSECGKVTDVEKRFKKLQDDKRCFICLGRNHRAKECRRTKNCRNCDGRHHQSICKRKSTKNEESHRFASHGSTDKDLNTTTTTTTTHNSRVGVVLQTAIAFVRGKDSSKTVEARILFDSGSQRSYVTKELREKLELPTLKSETLNLNTFGGSTFKKQNCDLVELCLSKRAGGGEEYRIKALQFNTICSSLPQINVQKYSHLQDLRLADDFDKGKNSIDILIGSDYYWTFMTGNIVRGAEGPVAIESTLGWVVSGTVAQSLNSQSQDATFLILSSEVGRPVMHDDLGEVLEKFWCTESIGIQSEIKDPAPQIEYSSFLQNITHDGKRYSVKLPWKPCMEMLQNHYDLSSTRANYLLKRLQRDGELLGRYDEIIKEQLSAGIIEPVTEMSQVNSNKIHYMPHHAVLREDKETTKIRILYDGSAHLDENDLSINDCLVQGPNLIPSLFDILLKFRCNKIGLIADIEKAFLMIQIDQADRDALRFLWYDNVKENPKLVTYRFCRLVFGLKPSPAILGSTIHHHLDMCEHLDPDVVDKLRDCLYVDDLITGEDSENEAVHLYSTSKNIMSKGGFNLRKWKTNSSEVREMIAESEDNGCHDNKMETKGQKIVKEEDQSYAKFAMGISQNDSEELVKTLGINWNVITDMLIYNFDELWKYITSLSPTKRSVLKFSARIFDPLGLVSPYTITLKILFQTMCENKLGWDDELPSELKRKWESSTNELKYLSNIFVPRCYFSSSSEIKNIELHGFSDASNRAYAAVVYLRVTYVNHVAVVLVSSKSRVAPLKTQTIPRLELLGAVILSRLMKTVNDALSRVVSIDSCYYWTDSVTVLCWIKNVKPWKQYVAHRVCEIIKQSSPDDWRHCPGQVNPADLPSRGISANHLVNSKLWWNGPECLIHEKENWPNQTHGNIVNETAVLEMLKQPYSTIHSLINLQVNNRMSMNIGAVMKCEQFSSFNRLQRVTAYVLRFISLLKHCENPSEAENNSRPLKISELENARDLWISSVQREVYNKEFEELRSGNTNSKLPYVRQFNLFISDSGILRCKGRLRNSSLPYDTDNPILLPSKHHLTELVIKYYHGKLMHSGVRDTLTTLRERYWIPRGREIVKCFIRRCVICTRYSGKTFPMLKAPALPEERVDDSPPWTNTGVDYAGPLYVKSEHNLSSSQKTSEKMYVSLFTCASTRAVHLELVGGCSGEQFLRAFRRFTSRRGVPRVMMSDNAKNFKSCFKEIENICRSQGVQDYMVNMGIKWKFIVEKAPWWGGFWERIVRIMKNCIKKTVGRSLLTQDELNTILVEVEGIINARPLTCVYDDVEGISYPLSPSQLIYGRRITTSPLEECQEIVSTNQSLTRRAKHHRKLLDQFSKQWQQEYLRGLREHEKSGKTRSGLNIAKGDVVILKEPKSAKCFWKLAQVEELMPGQDGVVRAAKIRVANQNPDRKSSVLRRPLQLLVPTEVKSVKEKIGMKSSVKPVEPVAGMHELNPDVDPFVPLLRRKAAVAAEQKRRLMK